MVVVSAAKKVAVGVEDGESTEVLAVGEVCYVICLVCYLDTNTDVTSFFTFFSFLFKYIL